MSEWTDGGIAPWHPRRVTAKASGDRVVVSVASVGGSWSADIDLDRGMVEWRRHTRRSEPRAGSQTIAPDKLAELRAYAERAHAQGDEHYRTQFADGIDSFKLTIGGETVTLTYETEGYHRWERVGEILDYARAVALHG